MAADWLEGMLTGSLESILSAREQNKADADALFEQKKAELEWAAGEMEAGRINPDQYLGYLSDLSTLAQGKQPKAGGFLGLRNLTGEYKKPELGWLSSVLNGELQSRQPQQQQQQAPLPNQYQIDPNAEGNMADVDATGLGPTPPGNVPPAMHLRGGLSSAVGSAIQEGYEPLPPPPGVDIERIRNQAIRNPLEASQLQQYDAALAAEQAARRQAEFDRGQRSADVEYGLSRLPPGDITDWMRQAAAMRVGNIPGSPPAPAAPRADELELYTREVDGVLKTDIVNLTNGTSQNIPELDGVPKEDVSTSWGPMTVVQDAGGSAHAVFPRAGASVSLSAVVGRNVTPVSQHGDPIRRETETNPPAMNVHTERARNVVSRIDDQMARYRDRTNIGQYRDERDILREEGGTERLEAALMEQYAPGQYTSVAKLREQALREDRAPARSPVDVGDPIEGLYQSMLDPTGFDELVSAFLDSDEGVAILGSILEANGGTVEDAIADLNDMPQFRQMVLRWARENERR
jgi:hypothetical protein